MTQTCPLHWPAGWPRKPLHKRQRSRFDKTLYRSVLELGWEIERLGGRHSIISTNLELRKRDGLPYANQGEPEDTGVAAWFVVAGEQRCIPCDRWTRLRDNVRAIGKTIEAMRGIERWGSGAMMQRTFEAFTALPSPEHRDPWHVVLGVEPNAPAEVIKAAYRALAKIAHPDAGGNHAAMRRLTVAYQEAKKALAQ